LDRHLQLRQRPADHQSWNATVVQRTAAVTAQNLTWNGALAPNASTTFGFLANWSGTNAVPAVSCTLS
jgi:cellulase/cellobiase CelA1